ncbi:MAG: Holliday junction branch migration protein RuvA [bacterium]|nr:Holliday junction branch migration protein RuvA [bacterium]
MIGHIEGTVRALRPTFAIISAGGVGYKIALTKEALAELRPEKTASLWTHLVVREDVLDLYGFRTEEELRIFELLLTVSGIGPKSAMAVLDVASVQTLRSAISQANASYLTEVSGIGKKTAEKIVLELKDKIGASSAESTHALRGDQDAQDAMRALGYSQNEAREALRKVPRDIVNSNDRLREALKIVGKR